MNKGDVPGDIIYQNTILQRVFKSDKFNKNILLIYYIASIILFSTFIIISFSNDIIANDLRWQLVITFIIHLFIVWPLFSIRHLSFRERYQLYLGRIKSNGIDEVHLDISNSLKFKTLFTFHPNTSITYMGYRTIDDGKTWVIILQINDEFELQFDGEDKEIIQMLASHFESLRNDLGYKVEFWKDFKNEWNIS